MPHFTRAACVLFGISVGALVWAENGPPLTMEDAEFMPRGQWEVVTAVAYTHGGDADSLAIPELEIGHGLAPGLMVEAEVELESAHPAGRWHR